MTKTHFEAIAMILNSQVPLNLENNDRNDAVSLSDLANDLADYFGMINPLFNRNLFLSAVNA